MNNRLGCTVALLKKRALSSNNICTVLYLQQVVGAGKHLLRGVPFHHSLRRKSHPRQHRGHQVSYKPVPGLFRHERGTTTLRLDNAKPWELRVGKEASAEGGTKQERKSRGGKGLNSNIYETKNNTHTNSLLPESPRASAYTPQKTSFQCFPKHRGGGEVREGLVKSVHRDEKTQNTFPCYKLS